MANIRLARLITKRSTIAGEVPTIPSSNDHADGSWLDTDIYEGELFYNVPDKKLYQRTGTGIVLLNEVKAEVTGNITATNDAFYTVTATATITDPTPVQGKGFTVIVRNGTATVGGTAYATVGTIIRRIFHSGAWANYTYNGNINIGDYLKKDGSVAMTGNLDTGGNNVNTDGGNVNTGGGNLNLSNGLIQQNGNNHNLPANAGTLLNTTSGINPTPIANSPIANGDTVNVAFGKAQGQINQISSDSFINAIIFG